MLYVLKALFAVAIFSPLNALAKSKAPVSKKPLKPINIPLTPFYKGTELQWYGEIGVGTPPQKFNVIFDAYGTGHQLTIPSINCKTCPKRQHKFNYNRSHTYVGPYSYSIGIWPHGFGVNPSVQWKYTCNNSFDTVTIGGQSVSNLPLELVNDESEYVMTSIVRLLEVIAKSRPYREVQYDGYMGMHTFYDFLDGTYSGFFGQLVQRGLPNVLGFHLAPRYERGAQLTLGGVDHSRYRGEMHTFLGVFSDAPTLRSNFIAVNGRTTAQLAKVLIVPSTITSTWQLDPSIASVIHSMISPDIKPNPAEPGTFGIPCHKIGRIRSEIDLSFTTVEGRFVNLTIPSSELSIGPFSNNKALCQTFITTYEFDEAIGYIGGSLLKHYYISFNYTDVIYLNVTIGFAHSVCE